MSEIRRPRRYYLAERLTARWFGDGQLEAAWRYKQEQEPGTALPGDFPYADKLSASGYTTVEDLDGANARELQLRALLNAREAEDVLAALLKFQAELAAAAPPPEPSP